MWLVFVLVTRYRHSAFFEPLFSNKFECVAGHLALCKFCNLSSRKGSISFASCWRACSLRSRACLRLISGNALSAKSFSFQLNLYLKCQSFEPLGFTSKYSPRSSKILRALLVGFAWTTAVSVRGNRYIRLKLHYFGVCQWI